jgi:hypothetical protein
MCHVDFITNNESCFAKLFTGDNDLVWSSGRYSSVVPDWMVGEHHAALVVDVREGTDTIG